MLITFIELLENKKDIFRVGIFLFRCILPAWLLFFMILIIAAQNAPNLVLCLLHMFQG